jgi:hypothetical protein
MPRNSGWLLKRILSNQTLRFLCGIQRNPAGLHLVGEVIAACSRPSASAVDSPKGLALLEGILISGFSRARDRICRRWH